LVLHPSDILVRPVITEKNTNLTPLGQYTFEVAATANKIMVKQAVEAIFGVKVRAVNILIVKPKKKRILRSRNFREFGFKGGYKKAIVSLEPGHTIDIFGDI
jgi:large subunit ribosomal protein L23